jgi:YHS domain-containing protein
MMKTLTSILGFALAVGFLLLVSSIQAEMHEQGHEHAKTHQHGDQTKSNDKVRCAIEGMMMKASAMTEMTHDGETYYFCNAKQAEMFKAHPDKYLKQISIGPLTLNLNLLTIDEYKEMMQEMGMGGMMKMDMMKGKTHRMSVYITQGRDEIALEGISLALQITDAKGKETTMPLTYNKMMKTYDAFAAVPAGGKHRIRVLITTPETNI